MTPYLTPRARALLPQITDKASSLIESAAGPTMDKNGLTGRVTVADPHAKELATFVAKLLGVSLSPLMDPNDSALREAVYALEVGTLSSGERELLERELPRMRGLARRLGGIEDDSPSDIRAILLADFINGRNEEGTMGENLHIGARRIFERYFELFSGMQAAGNRMGLYRASDVFEPAYRGRGGVGPSPKTELGPYALGERRPVAHSRLKAT